MPEYLAPGVYVEEVSSGLRPIEGVSTSNAGFAGGTVRGPTDQAYLVTSFQEFERVFGGLLDPTISFMPFAVRGFFENGGRRAFISRAFSPAAGQANLGQIALGDLTLDAIGPGDWAPRVLIWVTQNDPTGTNDTRVTFRMTLAYYDNVVDRDAATAIIAADADDLAAALRLASYTEEFNTIGNERNRSDFAVTVLKAGSNLVRATLADGGAIGTAAAEPMTGGDAQTNTARAEIAEALQRLEDVDEVNILCAPDQGRDVSISADLIGQCERLRDRFTVLQGEVGYQNPDDFRQNVGVSTFCGVYHPWVRVFDPTINDTILVPPSGHVAGVYARTDILRGVHKAPANEAVRGLYLREIGNERTLSQQINRQRHDLFNPANINIIRDFRSDGRGIRVFGARTFSADPEWRYVSVRRLFLFIEESVEEGTQWVVFEPNDDTTRAAVRRNVSAFLLGVWRSGALAGLTQEEAFFVKCDRETTTQADIDAGRLICLVGVAPVKPAEFVIFRFSQKTGDTE